MSSTSLENSNTLHSVVQKLATFPNKRVGKRAKFSTLGGGYAVLSQNYYILLTLVLSDIKFDFLFVIITKM